MTGNEKSVFYGTQDRGVVRLITPPPRPAMLLPKLSLRSDTCCKGKAFVATQNTSLSGAQRMPSIISCHKTHNALFHIFMHTVLRYSNPVQCNVLLLITFIISGEFQKLRSIFFILPLLLQEPGSSKLQLLTKPPSGSRLQLLTKPPSGCRLQLLTKPRLATGCNF